MSVVKHIIGSFGDIGGEIIKETVNVPKDIAGKALESLGTTTSQQKKGNQKQTKATSGKSFQTLDEVSKKPGDEAKKAIARAALQELVGTGKPEKKPIVWEQKQKEEEQKKKLEEEEKKKREKQALPKITTKQKPGDLYGILAKREGSEIGKNVKAE